MVDYEESFGGFLRRKLAEAGLTQSQACRRLGITSGMMSNWVNNKRVPEPNNVDQLARLLAVDPNEMQTRAGYRERRDTDLHPMRAELLEMARQLPLSEAEIVLGFMRWRLEEAYRPRLSWRSSDHQDGGNSGDQQSGS